MFRYAAQGLYGRDLTPLCLSMQTFGGKWVQGNERPVLPHDPRPHSTSRLETRLSGGRAPEDSRRRLRSLIPSLSFVDAGKSLTGMAFFEYFI